MPPSGSVRGAQSGTNLTPLTSFHSSDTDRHTHTQTDATESPTHASSYMSGVRDGLFTALQLN